MHTVLEVRNVTKVYQQGSVRVRAVDSVSLGLERGQADTFVGMYVNQWTRDYGPTGRQAVREFLDRGTRAGVIPHSVAVEFVDG